MPGHTRPWGPATAYAMSSALVAAPSVLAAVLADPASPPLSDVRVLDFTRYVSGPYATMLLADAGAEVIKVEPEGGEVTRRLPPFTTKSAEESHSTYFLRLNRGKKSVVLDPRNPERRPLLVELIRSADVLVENFRPGAMEAWGFGWQQLQEINPGLVYASISGFGHSPSPRRDWAAFNLVAETMAGVVSQLPAADAPARSAGLPFGDNVASLHAVNGILMALLRRANTGRGSRVDIAMYDAMVSMNEWSVACQSGAGIEVELGATVHPWFAPYGLFEAADGWLCICVATDAHWPVFCHVAGLDDLAGDERLRQGTDRAAHFAEVIEPRLSAWLSGIGAVEAATRLAEAGIPASPLQRPADLLDCDQAAARDMVVDFPLGGGDSIRLAGNPVRIEPRQAANAWGFSAPGENDDEVLAPLLARL
jgi:CoA:oxalate CoA-transferase